MVNRLKDRCAGRDAGDMLPVVPVARQTGKISHGNNIYGALSIPTGFGAGATIILYRFARGFLAEYQGELVELIGHKRERIPERVQARRFVVPYFVALVGDAGDF